MYYIVYISLTYSKLKDTFGGGRYIPKRIESHTPMWVYKWSCVSTIHWINQLATENASKIARYFVKLITAPFVVAYKADLIISVFP